MFVSLMHFPCLYWVQILCMKMESPSILMVSSDMLLYQQLHPFVLHCTILKYHAKGQHVMLLCDVTIHSGLLISKKIRYLCLGKQFDAFLQYFKLSLKQKYSGTQKSVCLILLCNFSLTCFVLQHTYIVSYTFHTCKNTSLCKVSIIVIEIKIMLNVIDTSSIKFH